MTRILLPLAIVVALYFGPLYEVSANAPDSGRDEIARTGEYFIGNAVGCMTELRAPLGEDCAFDKDFFGNPLVGHVINWATLLAVAAALVGVIGILPVVGRLTSIVTVLAGLGGIGAMGLMALTMMGTDAGLGAIRWGTYLTAGAGLLTLISGLGGMRGAR